MILYIEIYNTVGNVKIDHEGLRYPANKTRVGLQSEILEK